MISERIGDGGLFFLVQVALDFIGNLLFFLIALACLRRFLKFS